MKHTSTLMRACTLKDYIKDVMSFPPHHNFRDHLADDATPSLTETTPSMPEASNGKQCMTFSGTSHTQQHTCFIASGNMPLSFSSYKRFN